MKLWMSTLTLALTLGVGTVVFADHHEETATGRERAAEAIGEGATKQQEGVENAQGKAADQAQEALDKAAEAGAAGRDKAEDSVAKDRPMQHREEM